MTDWHFYNEQLLGREPETTPGTPNQGYFRNRRRYTIDNDDPNRKPGDPRKKICHETQVIAIWFDETWNALITGELGERYIDDVDDVDSLFSRICRNAITFEEYEREVQSYADNA